MKTKRYTASIAALLSLLLLPTAAWAPEGVLCDIINMVLEPVGIKLSILAALGLILFDRRVSRGARLWLGIPLAIVTIGYLCLLVFMYDGCNPMMEMVPI